MKLRPTKFVVRENTASLRQHASRVASDTRSNIADFEEERPEAQPTSSRNAPSVKVPENPCMPRRSTRPQAEMRETDAIFSMCTK